MLDGYLARRRKQITTLGQLMDPLADKLLITAALVSLVQMDLAPAWMVAVILGREFAVTVLRSIAHGKGMVIAASPLGKFKMLAEVVAILALILGQDHLQQFYVIGIDRALGRDAHRHHLRHRLLPPLRASGLCRALSSRADSSKLPGLLRRFELNQIQHLRLPGQLRLAGRESCSR